MPRNIVAIDCVTSAGAGIGAAPQAVDKAPRKPPASENQWLVPRIQKQFWGLRMSVERIAAREHLTRLFVQAVVCETSVPVPPGPALVMRRRAA